MPARLQFAVKRDTPATKAQKERLYRLSEQHKITLDVDVERLTRSEASRITDKILAKSDKFRYNTLSEFVFVSRAE